MVPCPCDPRSPPVVNPPLPPTQMKAALAREYELDRMRTELGATYAIVGCSARPVMLGSMKPRAHRGV